MQETPVRFLGQEDPLEKKMATYSSILAWRILWTEETGGLQFMGPQRVGHDWVTLSEDLWGPARRVLVSARRWWALVSPKDSCPEVHAVRAALALPRGTSLRKSCDPNSRFLVLALPALPVDKLILWKSESHSVMSNSVTPCAVTRQAPLSMEFSRQEYWSGYLLPSSGDLPNPGIESGSPALQADSLPSEPPLTLRLVYLWRLLFS